jgi:hypothetical protein
MGIDYGHGKTNIDLETGIRYGVISLHSITQAWCDSSEPYYPCKECEHSMGDDSCSDEDCEPSSFFYKEDGYQAETCFNNTEIMIYKSPYFTYGAFCSPCCPGAININDTFNPNNYNVAPVDNHKAYCFNHDWFEEEKAPYKVFSVKTGREIFKWDYLLRYHYENSIREFNLSVYANTIGEANKQVKEKTPDWMYKTFASSVLTERK